MIHSIFFSLLLTISLLLLLLLCSFSPSCFGASEETSGTSSSSFLVEFTSNTLSSLDDNNKNTSNLIHHVRYFHQPESSQCHVFHSRSFELLIHCPNAIIAKKYQNLMKLDEIMSTMKIVVDLKENSDNIINNRVGEKTESSVVQLDDDIDVLLLDHSVKQFLIYANQQQQQQKEESHFSSSSDTNSLCLLVNILKFGGGLNSSSVREEILQELFSTSKTSSSSFSWTWTTDDDNYYYSSHETNDPDEIRAIIGCSSSSEIQTTIFHLVSKHQQKTKKISSSSSSSSFKILNIHLLQQPTSTNWYSRGVTTTGNSGQDLWRALQIEGKGYVIGFADTGVDTDHCYFDDPDYSYPLQYNKYIPNHRKIARYQTFSDDEAGRRDGLRGHGTHVAGTLAGSLRYFFDQKKTKNFDNASIKHQGFAPLARLSISDIEGRKGMMVVSSMSQLFDTARSDGAFVHSNSWGTKGFSSYATYTTHALQTDAYMYLHQHFLAVFASGNDADVPCTSDKLKNKNEVLCDHFTTMAPCTSKNAFCVGSSMAPLASWQEADLGNFLFSLYRRQNQHHDNDVIQNNNSSSSTTNSEILLGTFNAVKAGFGEHHPHHLVRTQLHFVSSSSSSTNQNQNQKEKENEACYDQHLSNPEKLQGKIAVVYRGHCHFSDKAQRVQEAGAIMLIVINTQTGPAIEMGDDGATTSKPILIPCVMINQKDGATLSQLVSLYGEDIVHGSLRETSTPLETKNRHDLSGFSGRGPTKDFRFKPDIIAVGEFVHSAYSDANLNTHNCDLWASMGTSMATPQVSASAVLVREYFQRGFHGDGSEGSAASNVTLSSDAIKAVLILSAMPLTGVLDRNMHGDIRHLENDLVPSFEQGHGILRLASVLPAKVNHHQNLAKKEQTSENKNLDYFFDQTSQQETLIPTQNGISVVSNFSMKHDEVKSFCFKFSNDSSPKEFPFRAVLSWIDPPSSTPDANSKKSLLIDDFDLIVDDPIGRRYFGNKHQANSPNIPDTRNNVEKVTISDSYSSVSSSSSSTKSIGVFRITVHAARLTSSSSNNNNNNRVRASIAVTGTSIPCSSYSFHRCLASSDCGPPSSSSTSTSTSSSSRKIESQGKCKNNICFCKNGYRGVRCDIAPLVAPHRSFISQIYPMQWEEFLLVPSSSSGGGTSKSSRSVQVSLRSMNKDGDPNIFIGFNETRIPDREQQHQQTKTSYSLENCDDCDMTAPVPRPLQQLSNIPLSQSTSMFIQVTAACCWWSTYELFISAETVSVPTSISAARVQFASSTTGNNNNNQNPVFVEMLLQIVGDNPISARLHSKYSGSLEHSVFASSFWCNEINQCAFQFLESEVNKILCLTTSSLNSEISLEISYSTESKKKQKSSSSSSSTITTATKVRVDHLRGASDALNCTKIKSLPIILRQNNNDHQITTTPSPNGQQPSSSSSTTTTIALLVSSFSKKRKQNQQQESSSLNLNCHGGSDSSSISNNDDVSSSSSSSSPSFWSNSPTLPPEPLVRPSSKCFLKSSCNIVTNKNILTDNGNFEKQIKCGKNNNENKLEKDVFEHDDRKFSHFLVLPRSISDFPFRLGIHFNTTQLRLEYGIRSVAFLQISFRSEDSGAEYHCHTVIPHPPAKEHRGTETSGGEEGNGEEEENDSIICDLGGSFEPYIQSQSKLVLQFVNMYGEHHLKHSVSSVGVAVIPEPQSSGFVAGTSTSTKTQQQERKYSFPNKILSDDTSLSPSETELKLGVIGNFLWPNIQDAFSQNDNDNNNENSNQQTTIALAPQVENMISLSKIYISPADDTLVFSLGSFGLVSCLDFFRNQNSSKNNNIPKPNHNLLPCIINRHRVPCGVPLTLHINTARALFGHTSPISENTLFPAVNCGLLVSGIDAPGRAVHAVSVYSDSDSDSSKSKFFFEILGQFDTATNLQVTLSSISIGDKNNNSHQGSNSLFIAPKCEVVSKASSIIRVACSLINSTTSRNSLLLQSYQISLHGIDTSFHLFDDDEKKEQQQQGKKNNGVEFTVSRLFHKQHNPPLMLLLLPSQYSTIESSSTASKSSLSTGSLVVVSSSSSSQEEELFLSSNMKFTTRLKFNNLRLLHLFPGNSNISSSLGKIEDHHFFLEVLISTSSSVSSSLNTNTNSRRKYCACEVEKVSLLDETLQCDIATVCLMEKITKQDELIKQAQEKRNQQKEEQYKETSNDFVSSSELTTKAIPTRTLNATITLWFQGQAIPVFKFSGYSQIFIDKMQRDNFNKKDLDIENAKQHRVQFAARPSPSAALAQSVKPFEIVSTLLSPNEPALYLTNISLFAVSGDASLSNPCRAASSHRLIKSSLSLSQYQSVVALPRIFEGQDFTNSSSLNRNNNNDIVSPLRFDHVYPCSTSWLMHRAFFVVACATLSSGSGSSSNSIPIQLDEWKPPKFVALHVTSYDSTSTESRLGSNSPHKVIRLAPVCVSSSSDLENDNGTGDDQSDVSTNTTSINQNNFRQNQQQHEIPTATLLIGRKKTILLSVTVNVAIHRHEVKQVQKPTAEKLVDVTRIFLSSTPNCLHPIKETMSKTNPSLTTTNTHEEHWWSQTVVSYTFIAARAFDAKAVSNAFPARNSYVCVKWKSNSDTTTTTNFTTTSTTSTSTRGIIQQQLRSRREETSILAVAKHGLCDSDKDCDGNGVGSGSSYCNAERICSCPHNRRGAWCERLCPFNSSSSSSSSLRATTATTALVCSGNGRCNRHAECECSKGFFGEYCGHVLEKHFDTTSSSSSTTSSSSSVYSVYTLKKEKRISTTSSHHQQQEKEDEDVIFHFSLELLPSCRRVQVVLHSDLLVKAFSASSSNSGDSSTSTTTSTTSSSSNNNHGPIHNSPSVIFWNKEQQKDVMKKLLSLLQNREQNNNNQQQQQTTSSSSASASSSSISSSQSTNFVKLLAAKAVVSISEKKVINNDNTILSSTSPTFSNPKKTTTVPFEVVSVIIPSSLVKKVIQLSSSTNNNNNNNRNEIPITFEIIAESDITSKGGCESGICVVIAIFCGLLGAGLGFWFTFVILEKRRQKEIQQHHSAVPSSEMIDVVNSTSSSANDSDNNNNNNNNQDESESLTAVAQHVDTEEEEELEEEVVEEKEKKDQDEN